MSDKQNNSVVACTQAITFTDLHFFLCEANNRQGLHHSFPIILITDGAESGTVALNKTIKYYTTTDGIIAQTSV